MPELPFPDQVPAWARTIAVVAGILVTTFVLNVVLRRLVTGLVGRLRNGGRRLPREQAKRVATLSLVLRAGMTTLIWMIGLMLALSEAGLNIGPILATAGIGGVALGFGAQNMVRDFLAGIFVLLEEQYYVGDIVEIAGVIGTVEKITLRTTTLRDIEGRVHVVPNGEIRVSTNHTKGFSRHLLDLPVPYDEDIDRVAETVTQVAGEMQKDPEYAGKIIRPVQVLGVEAYGSSSVTLRAYIDTIAGEQWNVGRELRRRLKHAYSDQRISSPYPRQVMVHSEPAGATGED
jgi:moderate conductance mechanosensitive channel